MYPYVLLLIICHQVITVNLEGEITFANAQFGRLLQYEVQDVIANTVDKYIESDSHKHLRKMIRDLVDAEKLAVLKAEGYIGSGSESTGEETGPGSDSRNIDSGTDPEGNDSNSSGSGALRNGGNSSSSDPNSSDPNNVVSRSSDQSSPMREVKVDRGESTSDSSDKKDDFEKKHKSSSTDEASNDKEESPPVKKAKFNVDDVMGERVTANNADAKLSSLHYHKNGTNAKDPGLKSLQQLQQPCLRKKHELTTRTSSSMTDKQEDQSSSVESSLSKTKPLNSSDSGYREESNESTSSTMSNTSDDVALQKDREYMDLPLLFTCRYHFSVIISLVKRTVNRTPPLAPSCNICIIRKDQSTVWCELTASIRTRSILDDFEANTMGSTLQVLEEMQDEDIETKEILICIRPIREGSTVERESQHDKNWNKKVKIVIPHKL
jgi:hypothetical protein